MTDIPQAKPRNQTVDHIAPRPRTHNLKPQPPPPQCRLIHKPTERLQQHRQPLARQKPTHKQQRHHIPIRPPVTRRKRIHIHPRRNMHQALPPDPLKPHRLIRTLRVNDHHIRSIPHTPLDRPPPGRSLHVKRNIVPRHDRQPRTAPATRQSPLIRPIRKQLPRLHHIIITKPLMKRNNTRLPLTPEPIKKTGLRIKTDAFKPKWQTRRRPAPRIKISLNLRIRPEYRHLRMPRQTPIHLKMPRIKPIAYQQRKLQSPSPQKCFSSTRRAAARSFGMSM